MNHSPLEYSRELIELIESSPTHHFLSWYELLWHSIYDGAIAFWHSIAEAMPPSSITLLKPPMMADSEAARISMDLSPQLPASLALTCDDGDRNLKSFQQKQTITVSGSVVHFATGQVIGISTYTKTIPIYLMKGYFFTNEAYRARLEKVSSPYELQCFHALHTHGLKRLYRHAQKGLEKSRATRKALRKPIPNLQLDGLTPEHVRMILTDWEPQREHKLWHGQFKYLASEGEKKLEKAGRKSRRTRAWIVGVRGLIEECEVRMWKADKEWVIEKRNERPLPRKERRWREGRPGWTGLTPDDIGLAELDNPDPNMNGSDQDEDASNKGRDGSDEDTDEPSEDMAESDGDRSCWGDR